MYAFVCPLMGRILFQYACQSRYLATLHLQFLARVVYWAVRSSSPTTQASSLRVSLTRGCAWFANTAARSSSIPHNSNDNSLPNLMIMVSVLAGFIAHDTIRAPLMNFKFRLLQFLSVIAFFFLYPVFLSVCLSVFLSIFLCDFLSLPLLFASIFNTFIPSFLSSRLYLCPRFRYGRVESWE